MPHEKTLSMPFPISKYCKKFFLMIFQYFILKLSLKKTELKILETFKATNFISFFFLAVKILMSENLLVKFLYIININIIHY